MSEAGEPTVSEAIVFERVIDATPDEAFRLFTEPERLRRWMGLSASIDLRVGGETRLTVVPGSVNTGQIVEVEPGRRFTWTWGWQGSTDPAPGSTTVAVDFESVEGGTRVRLTHSGLGPEAAAGHGDGWDHFMDRLQHAASDGDAGPDPWAAGPEELDHLSAAEATWAICSQVLRSIDVDEHNRQTPCSDYDVVMLAEHLLGSVRQLGEAADAVTPEVPAGAALGSLEDQVAVAVEPCLAAWRERGLGGELPFGDGMAPAEVLAGILSLEFLVHAWDFAHATGQTIHPAPHVVAFVQQLAENTIRPEYRGPGTGFGDIIKPASGEPLDVLIGFTGRQV